MGNGENLKSFQVLSGVCNNLLSCVEVHEPPRTPVQHPL